MSAILKLESAGASLHIDPATDVILILKFADKTFGRLNDAMAGLASLKNAVLTNDGMGVFNDTDPAIVTISPSSSLLGSSLKFLKIGS